MVDQAQPKTPAWPPRSAPRLFVDQELTASAAIEIGGSQAHYLARVMRVGVGDAVILCDNVTGEWACRVTESGKRNVLLEVADHLREREDVPDIWLCPALLKKDRFDLVLEKSTELGVAEIHPVIMRRCVADKLNMDRARNLTVEAAEQCARTALPTLNEPKKLEQLLRDWPQDRTLFFADEMGGITAGKSFAESDGPAAILIGPEGGFDDAERAMLREHPNVKTFGMGSRILRAETAAISALSMWMGVKGDW